MRTLFLIIMVGFIISMFSCSEEEAGIPSAPSGPTTEELEANVVENCHIVRDAVEEYRANNGGECPLDIYTDTNELGLTLIDLLPDGQLLENPFTGERTEPIDTIATESGQTGYYRISRVYNLYYINGVGESFTVAEFSSLEELLLECAMNVYAVQEAAEHFAALNGGEYPGNVDHDTTPEGYTLVDLLPDGQLLENPFTSARTEPGDGAACTTGQVGYNPIVWRIGEDYVNAGYIITGCGHLAGVTISEWVHSPDYTCIRINNETLYCDR